jgi:hypothetical protein
MGRVSDDDLLPEAVAELYSSDPDEFIRRRGLLAAHAREAGVPTAAKQISGLRKPTRSAWTVNQLVRAVPGVTAQLAELGEQLRAAQKSLDGAAIRDLSLRRRQLIDALTRQAFKVSDQHSPPAALREEVAATLGAALADPQVAERVQAGTLDRPARSDGFGNAGAPILALVPPSSAGRRARAVTGALPARASNSAAASPAVEGATTTPARPTKAAELAAARAKAERQRRRQAITEAERTVAEADCALGAAAKAEQEQEDAVQSLEERLADARHRLADARLSARQARTAQHHARQALDRLRR